ncbi:unnamed protein product [Linum tenue]|uniref:Uncharacterized protein n=1 Tax=Linum tenue TaxID=586396 RepID=A0AAV0Q280_9ROSI|nr:unnamed protein product [Linum tenue]
MKGLLFGAIVCLLVLLPAALSHDPEPSPSSPKKGRVANYRMSDGLGTPTEACGYAKTDITYNYGNVAAALSNLWKTELLVAPANRSSAVQKAYATTLD